jgi:hypothetical protein
MRIWRMLLLCTVPALAAFSRAVADEAPQLPTQVAVAGRWLSLPLPEGYCAFDQTDPVQSGFTESQWRQSRDSGRRTLYPFAHCAELKEFRAHSRATFSFGSYDALLEGESIYTLPSAMTTASFLESLMKKPPEKFDPAEVETQLNTVVERGGAPLTRAGLFASEPDATYFAVFQRISTGRKKDETMSVFGMTGITVVAGVPLIVALMRYGALGTAVYDELLESEKSIIISLHAANP